MGWKKEIGKVLAFTVAFTFTGLAGYNRGYNSSLERGEKSVYEVEEEYDTLIVERQAGADIFIPVDKGTRFFLTKRCDASRYLGIEDKIE